MQKRNGLMQWRRERGLAGAGALQENAPPL